MLRTDFKDDVFATQVDHRSYEMTNEGGNIVSFEDVTEYDIEGDTFGAAELNATNAAVNKLNTYLSGTLVANTDNLTINAPNDDMEYFFNSGHIDVYVPDSLVQNLVVKNVEVTEKSGSTPSKCKITFTNTISSAATIEVSCN